MVHPLLNAKPHIGRDNGIVWSAATVSVMEIRDDSVDATVETAVKGFHRIQREPSFLESYASVEQISGLSLNEFNGLANQSQNTGVKQKQLAMKQCDELF